jgi:hypothetical protein
LAELAGELSFLAGLISLVMGNSIRCTIWGIVRKRHKIKIHIDRNRTGGCIAALA